MCGLCDFAELSGWKTDLEINDIESWYCVQDESKDSFSVCHLVLVPTMITDTSIVDKHLPLGKYSIDTDLCVRENASMNVCLHTEVCMVRTMPSYIGSETKAFKALSFAFWKSTQIITIPILKVRNPA